MKGTNKRKMKSKKQRAMKLAKKLIGKNYFTELQKIILQSAIELSDRKDSA